jgi:hypothetical protein
VSNFNFTNVDINSGRKQIIDIFNDKKVIDDRIERTSVGLKKSPIVARFEGRLFSRSKLNGRTSFDKKLTSSIRDGFIGSTIEFLAITPCNLPVSQNCVQFFTF